MQYSTRVAMFAVMTAAAAHAQVRLSGRVVDDAGAPLTRARISAHKAGETPVTAETGPTGAFHLDLPEPGKYLVTVQRTGYFQLSERPVDVGPAAQEVTLVLNPNRGACLSGAVNVGESSSSPVDPAQTDREQRPRAAVKRPG